MAHIFDDIPDLELMDFAGHVFSIDVDQYASPPIVRSLAHCWRLEENCDEKPLFLPLPHDSLTRRARLNSFDTGLTGRVPMIFIKPPNYILGLSRYRPAYCGVGFPSGTWQSIVEAGAVERIGSGGSAASVMALTDAELAAAAVDLEEFENSSCSNVEIFKASSECFGRLKSGTVSTTELADVLSPVTESFSGIRRGRDPVKTFDVGGLCNMFSYPYLGAAPYTPPALLIKTNRKIMFAPTSVISGHADTWDYHSTCAHTSAILSAISRKYCVDIDLFSAWLRLMLSKRFDFLWLDDNTAIVPRLHLADMSSPCARILSSEMVSPVQAVRLADRVSSADGEGSDMSNDMIKLRTANVVVQCMHYVADFVTSCAARHPRVKRNDPICYRVDLAVLNGYRQHFLNKFEQWHADADRRGKSNFAARMKLAMDDITASFDTSRETELSLLGVGSEDDWLSS